MNPLRHAHATIRSQCAVVAAANLGGFADNERARRQALALCNMVKHDLHLPEAEHPLLAEIWRLELDKAVQLVDAFAARWGQPGRFDEAERLAASACEQFAACILRLLDRLEHGFAGRSPDHPVPAPQPTGVEELDRDHERYFGLLGGMRAAVGGGAACLSGAMINELVGLLESHIAREEELMLASHYPGYEDHRAEHHRARTLVLGFRNDHLAGRCVAAPMVLAFIEHWFATHVAHTDKALAEHLLAAVAR